MSKGLEALAELYSYIKPSFDYQTAKAVEDYKIIEKELKDKEKKDEALEIIKTKLLVGCFSEKDNYSNYVMAIMMSGNEELKKNMMTEKEYNLIREVWL